MSIQITSMSDLEDVLIIHEWEAKITSLKMWVVLINFSMMSEVRGRLVFLTKYRIFKIFQQCSGLRLLQLC